MCLGCILLFFPSFFSLPLIKRYCMSLKENKFENLSALLWLFRWTVKIIFWKYYFYFFFYRKGRKNKLKYTVYFYANECNRNNYIVTCSDYTLACLYSTSVCNLQEIFVCIPRANWGLNVPEKAMSAVLKFIVWKTLSSLHGFSLNAQFIPNDIL